jgi:uncharacterized protein
VLIFLDANVVIYAVEGTPPWGVLARERIAHFRGRDNWFVITHLVRMEARVHPLARGAASVLLEYDTFFQAEDVEVFDLSQAVCDRATEIRAAHGFQAVDSLHLAAAIEAGCEVFLTNDARLQGFEGLRVEVLG